jgi:hypothetical protein
LPTQFRPHYVTAWHWRGLDQGRNAETRGKEVRKRRAYSDEEVQALLDVAGKHRILYVMAVLTGIRHGEFKKLCWGDVNLNAEKPFVMVRASVSKNHKQACLPLHRVLLADLVRYRPENVSAGDLIFGKLVPRSDLFRKYLIAAAITKKDSMGRVADFHSFRHTFCTYLHRVGVPLREAMELMRHSDVRLTMNIYTDSSLFALRPAVEKLPWNYSDEPIASQGASQILGATCLLPSLHVTNSSDDKAVKTIENTVGIALHGVACHVLSQIKEWSERQDSNLSKPLDSQLVTKPNAQRDSQTPVHSLHDLAQVVTAWPKLPTPLKAAVLAIINSSEGQP